MKRVNIYSFHNLISHIKIDIGKGLIGDRFFSSNIYVTEKADFFTFWVQVFSPYIPASCNSKNMLNNSPHTIHPY